MDDMLIGALDIGGTKIAASIASAEGPLVRVTQPTVRSGPQRALGDQALALLADACRQAGVERGRVSRLGVSSCGPFIKTDEGISLATPNLCGGLSGASDLPNDWTEIPLERVLRETFSQVVIRNDCVAALTGERLFGAVHDEPDCVYVTWSTGIGFGLCVDGHILGGKHGNAGHAGHMLISERVDAVCGCGNLGDVEGLISGRNLGKRAGKDASALFAAAREGSHPDRDVVSEAAQWFGKALYNLAVALDTRVFVIGGSVWLHHGDWMTPIVQHELETRLPALTRGVSIRCPALGALVADIGALGLVMPPAWIDVWRQTQPWQKLAV